MSSLDLVEKKVLGALYILMDDNNVAKAKMRDIADIINYKSTGGAMSFALKVLERDNYIIKLDKGKYQVLV